MNSSKIYVKSLVTARRKTNAGSDEPNESLNLHDFFKSSVAIVK
jgi:hypothetical protein